jgi:hypothetical protein
MSVAIPQFMKNIQKSLYGTVPAAWCLTVVCMRAHSGEKHCCSRSADPDMLVESSLFYSACVVLIDLFAQIKTRKMDFIFK